jgi:transcription elongation factor GreA
MLLATARVIEDNKKKKIDTIQVGATVTIQEDGLEDETYTIVGAAEANPREGLISNESPMGKALLNQRVGDEVEIETPDGSYTVRIVKIG